jgi:uncharacterized phage-like protein YoqJ
MIIAVTGHRPNKLGGYSSHARKRLVDFAKETLVLKKPDKVLTGMAQGWDQAVARACVSLDIPFIACVPFRGQENTWTTEDIIQYRKLLQKAIDVRILFKGGYAPWKMHERNEWMVNNCQELMALWNGQQEGGTFNCVHFAKSVLLPIENVWPEWVKFVDNNPLQKPSRTDWRAGPIKDPDDEIPF